ncbi:hypothetical protein [Rhizobium miluonense]|nr:hypothetical protein [Rhizobium miluonense]
MLKQAPVPCSKFVFALTSRELVASIVLAPVGVQTIATFIWRQFE